MDRSAPQPRGWGTSTPRGPPRRSQRLTEGSPWPLRRHGEHSGSRLAEHALGRRAQQSADRPAVELGGDGDLLGRHPGSEELRDVLARWADIDTATTRSVGETLT